MRKFLAKLMFFYIDFFLMICLIIFFENGLQIIKDQPLKILKTLDDFNKLVAALNPQRLEHQNYHKLLKNFNV